MKYRSTFVANSSTSSYTCVVCRDTVADRDLSCFDAEMYGCKHGHYFHASCTELSDIGDWSFERPIILQYMQQTYDRNMNDPDSYWNQNELDDLKRLIKYLEEHPSLYYEEIDEEDLDEMGLVCWDWRDVNASIRDYRFESLEQLPEKYCPVCRFEVIAPDELEQYVLKEKGGIDAVLHEIKTRFNSYGEFKEYNRS